MTNKICTSLEVSKKLKELGFEAENYFYWWYCDFEKKYTLTSEYEYFHADHIKNKIGAYTLEQILEMLPPTIKTEEYGHLVLSHQAIEYDTACTCDSHAECPMNCLIDEVKSRKDNLATTAACLLIQLKENKII